MRRSLTGCLLTPLLLVASACEQSANRADEERDSLVTRGAAPMAPTTDSASRADTTGGHSPTSHAAAAGDGQALLPIMQKLGSDMTALTYALMTDDHETVARSAAEIAEHAPIAADDLARIQTELGPDMAAFEAVDESVHVASVRLHEAARARQPGLVVERLGEVQRGCVSCHARFRERLRTNRAAR